jgi:hypothetical protein
MWTITLVSRVTMTDYDVVKRGKQWAPLREGADKVSGLYSSQLKAEKAAKKHASNSGGGEVRIHGRDGRIRDSDTIAPKKDPFPPRDTKH